MGAPPRSTWKVASQAKEQWPISCPACNSCCVLRSSIRGMIFSLVVAVAVLGAKPSFEDVVKKFPAAKLPMTIDELPTLKAELTAADIEVLGFLKDKSAALKGLREWKEPPYSGDAVAPGSKHLRPIAA